jgi:hypothetical protein
LADFRQADGEVFLKVSIASASCLTLKAECASVTARGRQAEVEAAPIRYVAAVPQ